MTILSKLNLTDMSRSKMIASPKARLRHKLLGALEEQIAAANADKNDETFVKRASRLVTDQETGEQVKRDVPVHFAVGGGLTPAMARPLSSSATATSRWIWRMANRPSNSRASMIWYQLWSKFTRLLQIVNWMLF